MEADQLQVKVRGAQVGPLQVKVMEGDPPHVKIKGMWTIPLQISTQAGPHHVEVVVVDTGLVQVKDKEIWPLKVKKASPLYIEVVEPDTQVQNKGTQQVLVLVIKAGPLQIKVVGGDACLLQVKVKGQMHPLPVKVREVDLAATWRGRDRPFTSQGQDHVDKCTSCAATH